ncbi:hypothetical protein ES708_33150 [subsurface metagenome]
MRQLDVGGIVGAGNQRVASLDVQAADIGVIEAFTAGAKATDIEVNSTGRRNGVCHPVDIAAKTIGVIGQLAGRVVVIIGASDTDKQGRAGSVV